MQIPPPIPKGERPVDSRGWEFDGYQWIPPEPEPMNLYGIIRKLVAGDQWSVQERREADELLTRLEQAASLGTITTRETTEARGVAE